MVVLDHSRHRLLVYNATAAAAWRAGATSRDVVAIADELARTFGIPFRAARQDAESILRHWQDEGLFQCAAPSAPAAPAARSPEQHEGTWAASWRCSIRNLVVEFAVEDPARVTAVRTLLQPFEVDPQTAGAPDVSIQLRQVGSGETALLVDGIEIVRAPAETPLKDSVHQALIERVYPDTPWLALLHGGAVARSGIAVAFSADSGCGKTTLIAYLLAQGYKYVADDLLVLTHRGTALPWPMPLSVKSGSLNALSSLYPGLGASVSFRTKGDTAYLLQAQSDGWEERELRSLVFPKFDAAAPPRLSEVRPLEALARLLKNRFWLGHPLTRDRVLLFLAWLRNVQSFSLSYSQLADAARHVGTVV